MSLSELLSTDEGKINTLSTRNNGTPKFIEQVILWGTYLSSHLSQVSIVSNLILKSFSSITFTIINIHKLSIDLVNTIKKQGLEGRNERRKIEVISGSTFIDEMTPIHVLVEEFRAYLADVENKYKVDGNELAFQIEKQLAVQRLQRTLRDKYKVEMKFKKDNTITCFLVS